MKAGQSEQGESNFPQKLSQPARRALAAAGFMRLEDLTKISEAELKKLHGIGPNALVQLRQAFEVNELSFAGEQRTTKG